MERVIKKFDLNLDINEWYLKIDVEMIERRFAWENASFAQRILRQKCKQIVLVCPEDLVVWKHFWRKASKRKFLLLLVTTYPKRFSWSRYFRQTNPEQTLSSRFIICRSLDKSKCFHLHSFYPCIAIYLIIDFSLSHILRFLILLKWKSG